MRIGVVSGFDGRRPPDFVAAAGRIGEIAAPDTAVTRAYSGKPMRVTHRTRPKEQRSMTLLLPRARAVLTPVLLLAIASSVGCASSVARMTGSVPGVELAEIPRSHYKILATVEGKGHTYSVFCFSGGDDQFGFTSYGGSGQGIGAIYEVVSAQERVALLKQQYKAARARLELSSC